VHEISVVESTKISLTLVSQIYYACEILWNCHMIQVWWRCVYWCRCLRQLTVMITVTVKLRDYSSVGSLPGKLGSTSSPMPSSSESVVARVYLCTSDCHVTNQYKSIIVSGVNTYIFLLFPIMLNSLCVPKALSSCTYISTVVNYSYHCIHLLNFWSILGLCLQYWSV